MPCSVAAQNADSEPAINDAHFAHFDAALSALREEPTMRIRHRTWLLAALALAIPLIVASPPPGALASPTNPVSVAIESVGVARQTGCAIVHIATSEPTPVRIDRTGAGRVTAEFAGAVLAPQATGALDRTPALRRAVRISQSTSGPPVVRFEATSARDDPPVVERFADGCGLIVRLFVDTETSPAATAPPLVERAAGASTDSAAVQVAEAAGFRSMPLAASPTGLPGRHASPVENLLRTVSALTGLATPGLTSSLEPRRAEEPILLAQALTTLPTGVVAARPQPLGAPVAKQACVERVRVVQIDPLTVAVDCSEPLRYQLDRTESGRAYVLRFPGAVLGPHCERAVALHPAGEAYVTADVSDGDAVVTIPVMDGQTCSVRPGAAAGTVVCELVAGDTRVAQQGTPAELTPSAPGGEPIVNLDFQDAPVVEILTALAKYASRNIVATTAVAGTMSVHLDNVTLTQALDVIVKLNGLEYALIGDRNYIVGTPEEVARFKPSETGKLPLQVTYKPTQTTPERIAHEMEDAVGKAGVTIRIAEDTQSVVFRDVPDQETAERLTKLASEYDVPPVETTRWVQLEHLTPAEAAAALEGLVTNVEVRMPGPEAPQVGVIGLVGKTTDVDQAEGLLATIDVERPPVAETPPGELVSRTLLVTYVDPKQVVEAVTAVFGEKVQAVVITAEQDLQAAMDTDTVGGLRPTGRILVRGAAPDVDAAEKLVADLDAPPPQVEITATITDVRVDRDKNVGFQWQLPGLIAEEQQTGGNGFSFGKFVRAPMNATGAGGFTGTFDALAQNTDTTILSRTTLIALQGKTANFLVGDIVPYETHVAGDGTVTSSVEMEEIGLGLKFAPTVDAQDGITLFISPRVRSFSGFSPQGYPIIATREAQSILRCKDGDVIAIGGLLRDEEVKSLSGIPFLKDIPFFGELFKKRQTQKRKSEVVVFAEVKLLRPDRRPAEPAVEEGMGK
jgi:type II secretory pathway component GspD/PulD (secretin)